MKDLRGRNAVVTGAASGIGRATAIEMAREGMNVGIADKNETGMEEVADKVRAQGVRAFTKKTDVSKQDEVKSLIDFGIDEFGGIDLLMNNAGVAVAGEMRDLSLEKDWEWIIGVDLWGPIYGCHYILPHMIKRGSGHIANVASAAGLFTSPAMAPYCAAKFGVVGMSEVLRYEVARFGIGVTCVCPAFVKTAIFESTQTRGIKMDMSKVNRYWGQKPEKTARLIVQGIKRNKGLLVLTSEAKVFHALKRFVPGIYHTMGPIVAKQLEKLREE